VSKFPHDFAKKCIELIPRLEAKGYSCTFQYPYAGRNWCRFKVIFDPLIDEQLVYSNRDNQDKCFEYILNKLEGENQ
jgi:hypothetical protein